jgi:hypothetical protein
VKRLIPFLFIGALWPGAASAQGGPPLMTDDPDTPGPGYWEINLAVLLQKSHGEQRLDLPRLDVNYGVGERIQLKFEMPWVDLQAPLRSWKTHDAMALIARQPVELDAKIDGRDASGDASIIGCNTVSHLSAGVFDICRIGDDTSGTEWASTGNMRSGRHDGGWRAGRSDTTGQARTAPCRRRFEGTFRRKDHGVAAIRLATWVKMMKESTTTDISTVKEGAAYLKAHVKTPHSGAGRKGQHQ